jgi:signal transduction histidine kinase
VGCFAVGMLAGSTSFALEVDSAMYDFMFRLNPPQASSTQSIVLMIDDPTLKDLGGIRSLRSILAKGLSRIAPVQPKLVAIDVILTDPGDPHEDQHLEDALKATPNVILATDYSNDAWEDPIPRLRRWAVAVGTTLADETSLDGVTREIPLEEAEHRERHWALSLEAFRVARGVNHILESPDDLQLGSTIIPARRKDNRPLRIRYLPDGTIPRVSLEDLLAEPKQAERFRGKAVFIGVYSNTAARDHVVTPWGGHMAGVEVNAQAFETLRRGVFYTDSRNDTMLAFCVVVAVAAGLLFAFAEGWIAYGLAALLLLVAHTVPFLFFHRGIVFPYFAPLSSAWLTVAGAAIYQHFVVRRQLFKSEDERTRYRQAIHFVTHEMRTPLTAIQGSSELIGRYNLNDDKRKQIAQMINSESKRLARMIQTFLDIERLTDGQIELKREPFDLKQVVNSCLDRARPIAERKNIAMHADGDLEGSISGDRELLEYAIYNLLTNAVKYSSSNTEVHISTRPAGDHVRLSVSDQGMGMEPKELKKIFQKFYRTKRAEASGEQGSGIGLSLVDQIVQHHKGNMEVTSTPGLGSCFTMVLPAFTYAKVKEVATVKES